ncbi:MAG: YsnF/AvaK domain-containing protein, partial [Pseudomonadota bacterium]|nr:YsnF/AvaK domain-containing protein [Pseudomonadota bacterium]
FGGDDEADPARSGYTDTYNEAFKRGGYGVSVTTANDDEADKAERILNDAGAVDIDEKAESWRKEGWTGGVVAPAMAPTGTGASLQAGTTKKLQEVEEEIQVGKRAVAKGGVRIFTRMTEVPVEETVRLREERANVQRTAVDRPATETDFAAFKEGSIEVREMSEEAVVSKSARVTGEVSVGKEVTEREEVIRDKVRKTTVDVEKIDAGTTSGKSTVSGAGYSGTTSSPNRDPISGALGAHPVGTAVGATAGGVAAGAAAGSVAGPVGTVVGAAVGAVAGGLAGKGAAEAVDPTAPGAKPTKKSY